METETTMTKNLYINYNACDSQFFSNTAFAQHFLVYDVLLFMTVHCFLSKLLFQPFMILSLFDYVRCIDYHVVGIETLNTLSWKDGIIVSNYRYDYCYYYYSLESHQRKSDDFPILFLAMKWRDPTLFFQ